MKLSRCHVSAPVRAIPDIRFEEQGETSLTSYAGLVIFQKLFDSLAIGERLRRCFQHVGDGGAAVPLPRIALILIVHFLIGCRRLRDIDYYYDDPIVLRTLGLSEMPDVSTVSRGLGRVDEAGVFQLRNLSRDLVMDRLRESEFTRLTLDFDGSVFSTGRHAEGTAVGFNKEKKGARSYYPLFCTVAETAQIFDLLHRPGNVHDSNGAFDFVRDAVVRAKDLHPALRLESRMDAAFFSEVLLDELNARGVEFTVSAPFARFPELKSAIENRKRWAHEEEFSWAEIDWRPKSWVTDFRILITRTTQKVQQKGPLQLDLFEPVSHEFTYKAIITNKRQVARKVVRFHHGRGAQEAIFAEAKSNIGMHYVPVKTLYGNQMYCLAAVISHNLYREIQMRSLGPARGTTEKRATKWKFESIRCLRQQIIQRAGRLIWPQGRLTMVMGSNPQVREDLTRLLQAA